MKAILQDNYGTPDNPPPRRHRQARSRGRTKCSSGARRRHRPGHRAPHARRALPDASDSASGSVARRTRCPDATSPGRSCRSDPTSPTSSPVTRCSASPQGFLRRVRRGADQTSSSTSRPASRSNRPRSFPSPRPPPCRRLRDVGHVQPGQRRADHRGVGRCRHLRRATRQGTRSHGHRCHAARRRSTSCARSAPTTSSTTRTRTSPTARRATT